MPPSVTVLERTLSQAIAENGSLNPLADLVHLLSVSEKSKETHKAIYALYRIFTLLVPKLFLPASQVKEWLWRQFNAYTDTLVELLGSEEEALRSASLKILFEFLKALSSTASASQTPQIHNKLLKKIVSGLLTKATDDVLETFDEDFLSKYDDVRWFFLREAGTYVSADSSAAQNLLSVLERIKEFPQHNKELTRWYVPEFSTAPEKSPSNDEDEEAEDDWRRFFDAPEETIEPTQKHGRASTLPVHKALHVLASHRAVFTRAWMLLLSQLSSEEDSARVLKILHRQVVPYMTPGRVVEVVDWVSGIVHRGTDSSAPEATQAQAFLAMNTLFVLMTRHNLDYPSFYPELLKLLTPSLLHSKHRSRFLRLLSTFLAPSNHLPQSLLADFCRRLGTLALHAPPGGIIPVLILVYNVILQSRGSLMHLIHSEDAEGQLHTLSSLLNHYLPSVCTISKLYNQPFTRKDPLAMEGFLDLGYASMLEKELTRKVKKEPAVGDKRQWEAFEEPASKRARLEDDLIDELWTA